MAATTQTGATTADIIKWIDGSIVDLTIDTAERVLREEVDRGFATEPTVVTDGAVRRDYRAVKPYGRIEFIRQPGMTEAVLWALEQLRALSPVGPAEGGHYRDDHWLLINREGYTGQDARKVLDRVKPGDRVQIANIRPYAAKIEGHRANRRRKWKRRRGLSRMAPNGVYRQVQKMVLQRFGKSVLCDLKMQQLEVGGIRATRASGFVRFPTLNFFIRQ